MSLTSPLRRASVDVGDRTFTAHSDDDGHSWWGAWDDGDPPDEPEWLLVPRPGHMDDLVIRADWTGNDHTYTVVATEAVTDDDSAVRVLAAHASGVA